MNIYILLKREWFCLYCREYRLTESNPVAKTGGERGKECEEGKTVIPG